MTGPLFERGIARLAGVTVPLRSSLLGLLNADIVNNSVSGTGESYGECSS